MANLTNFDFCLVFKAFFIFAILVSLQVKRQIVSWCLATGDSPLTDSHQ